MMLVLVDVSGVHSDDACSERYMAHSAEEEEEEEEEEERRRRRGGVLKDYELYFATKTFLFYIKLAN